MKFCEKCGKELMDEAMVCTGCGCATSNMSIRSEQKLSIFQKNKKQWIIVLSISFIVFAGLAVILLFLSTRLRDEYAALHTELGQLGARISDEGYREWLMEVNTVKSELLPYIIGIVIGCVLAIAALIGDLILLLRRKKQ